jgi:2-methylcitrate dehydratase PrpD
VAAAVSKLMRLDVGQTRHALTIAESHAPNLLAADHSGFKGGHVKEGIPWSVVSGYAAAHLAMNGFAGYDEALSNPLMYGPLRGDEDSIRPLVETTYYKRYACCRWMHSAIDAALQLQREIPAEEQVRSILIETFTRAATLPNQHQPGDLIAAQFSVPFMVSAAWVRGADALLPADESLLQDPRIVELAKRVMVVARPEFDELYPLKVPARVTVDTGMATAQATVISPVGDYDNPLADEALVDKAVHLSSRGGAPLAKPFLQQVLAGQVPAVDLFAALSHAG